MSNNFHKNQRTRTALKYLVSTASCWCKHHEQRIRAMLVVMMFTAFSLCCLCSVQVAPGSDFKDLTTVGANTQFTNAILALVVPDGTRVYVLKGNEAEAMELAKGARERVKSTAGFRTSDSSRVFVYNSTGKLYRAVCKLPLLPEMTALVTNAICQERYNIYLDCTAVSDNGSITWRKDIYKEPHICIQNKASTNICINTWNSNIGTSYFYLTQEHCTNGFSLPDRTKKIPGWVCSGPRNR